MITTFQIDGQLTTDHNQMMHHIKQYSIYLFGTSRTRQISLIPDQRPVDKKVSEDENKMLTAQISEEELKHAVFESGADKAPGPPSYRFYQTYWEIVKPDLLQIVNDFNKGALDTAQFNHAVMCLIPNGC